MKILPGVIFTDQMGNYEGIFPDPVCIQFFAFDHQPGLFEINIPEFGGQWFQSGFLDLVRITSRP